MHKNKKKWKNVNLGVSWNFSSQRAPDKMFETKTITHCPKRWGFLCTRHEFERRGRRPKRTHHQHPTKESQQQTHHGWLDNRVRIKTTATCALAQPSRRSERQQSVLQLSSETEQFWTTKHQTETETTNHKTKTKTQGGEWRSKSGHKPHQQSIFSS